MKRSLWIRIGTLGTAALLPISSAVAAPAPGAPGVGDPYFPNYGNGGYDVRHYTLNVEHDIARSVVSGRTEIQAVATQDLSRFNLDLVLPAKYVSVNNRAAKFSQTDHELIITAPTAVKRGAPLIVEVTYSGDPSTKVVNGVSPWIKTVDGAAAVGEPEMAPWWFAANDHPSDKATYDINLTVPKNVEAISNGVLRSSTITGNKRTWRWSESSPMAPYLAFFVDGQFNLTQGKMANGTPWLNALPVGSTPAIKRAGADLARTPEITSWLSSQFGPYPFTAVGGVAVNGSFGFALETQTRPVYPLRAWRTQTAPWLVVHEMAHQWFGDSVSVRNWQDIWLNEGFASYAEWLWSEKQGEGSRQALFDSYYLTPPDSPFWKVTIGDPGPDNLFNGAVYDRGAMTLTALRNRIGEANMGQLLRTWTAQKKDGNARIAEFKLLAEKISGQNLGGFFATWLYSAKRPSPTVANGFPADYPAGGRQTLAAPSSKAGIDAGRQMLTSKNEARQHSHAG